MKHLIVKDYEGSLVNFDKEGWINATSVATKFGCDPTDWLYVTATAKYVVAVAKRLGKPGHEEHINKINRLLCSPEADPKRKPKLLAEIKRLGLVKTSMGSPENGGGTWIHRKLAIEFARWLSADFAVWCDEQIEDIIDSKTRAKQPDWTASRHMAASAYKTMSAALKLVRDEEGKDTKFFHYVQEANLINKVLGGKFDRDGLDATTLDKLALLEVHNTIYLARGVDKDTRALLLHDVLLQLPTGSVQPRLT